MTTTIKSELEFEIRKLNKKEKMFLEEYMVHSNATSAVLNAGLCPNPDNARIYGYRYRKKLQHIIDKLVDFEYDNLKGRGILYIRELETIALDRIHDISPKDKIAALKELIRVAIPDNNASAGGADVTDNNIESEYDRMSYEELLKAEQKLKEGIK